MLPTEDFYLNFEIQAYENLDLKNPDFMKSPAHETLQKYSLK